MNYLIDTHAHLYAEQFKDDRKEMIERAFAQNIQKLFLRLFPLFQRQNL